MNKTSAAGISGPAVIIPDRPISLFHDIQISDEISIPSYLEQTYWWAYIHPQGVRFFERQWLVNLILWGNFSKLRDEALSEIQLQKEGKLLQIACVYGDFTPKVSAVLPQGASLDVVDVAPVQLHNLAKKLQGLNNIHLYHQDSTALTFEQNSYDNVVVFFLLHEQPVEVRIKTIHEALRVVRPGGKLIFVDYHRPVATNPFRYIMLPILKILEPFALDMWKNEIVDWIPKDLAIAQAKKETYFGGLYQKVVLIKE
ncbi:MAG: class I SAM-dependent methyltransferase [Magnetococcales bacterium]|nr:class I SAM-dependent methyltransferase [Magnetococcales bacterium]